MKNSKVDSFNTQIFIAGDASIAKQVCRKFCMEVGQCISVSETNYIYTGGEEKGVIIGFINYPRFPLEKEEIVKQAERLGHQLMKKLCQYSFSIQTPENTFFYSRRDENTP